jgi:hypothetical protein
MAQGVGGVLLAAAVFAGISWQGNVLEQIVDSGMSPIVNI